MTAMTASTPRRPPNPHVDVWRVAPGGARGALIGRVWLTRDGAIQADPALQSWLLRRPLDPTTGRRLTVRNGRRWLAAIANWSNGYAVASPLLPAPEDGTMLSG